MVRESDGGTGTRAGAVRPKVRSGHKSPREAAAVASTRAQQRLHRKSRKRRLVGAASAEAMMKLLKGPNTTAKLFQIHKFGL